MSPARRSRDRLALAGLLAAALSACGVAAPEPHTLRLRQATPEPGASGVFLNEPVELFFSEEIDAASVHAQSARLVGPGGAPARGRWEVDGRRLRFAPDPVLSADLSDGGFAPGCTYRVELAGFPCPDGLRGTSGAPLEATLRWEFETARPGALDGGDLFADASVERGLPLNLRTRQVSPNGPILLECEEPLDPSTLFSTDFLLQSKGGAQVALRARLIENFDKRAPRPRGTTLIELQPEGELADGPYQLHVPFESRLRDFGGHRVPYLPGLSGQSPSIEVIDDSGQRGNRHRESFMDGEEKNSNRSSELVPGVDGTAYWGRSGRVEVRLPAAIGDGRDGSLELQGQVGSPDLQAVRARIPPAARAELSSAPGLVFVRCQGALRIEGSLVRNESAALAGELLAGDFLPGESLSEWLERAQGEGRSATVLIAGGDLILSGAVEVKGALVLAAGGRLRLGEASRMVATKLYLLGEGAGNNVAFFDPKLVSEVTYSQPDKDALDLARTNLLAEPLTFAVRSGPIPRDGRAQHWHAARHAGAEGYRVRYIGTPSGPRGEGRSEVIVEDPVQLDDSPTLRLQIELTVEPGPTWDPPWVDYVEVTWEPERPR